jgi:hypothetical protein
MIYNSLKDNNGAFFGNLLGTIFAQLSSVINFIFNQSNQKFQIYFHLVWCR